MTLKSAQGYLLLFIILLSTYAISSLAKAEVQVNLTKVRHHLKILSSDKFAGRGPLSQGETLTINYLAQQYKKLGLSGGDHGHFLEPVPLTKITPNPGMVLHFNDLSLQQNTDFTARTEQVKTKINLVNSAVVFVGYGINAPEYHWNDYKNVNVKGKTVIILVNDPGFATQNNKLFTGNAMTYYGRWTYKYEEAARQGAKAVFIVHETAPAGYPWGVVKNSNSGSKFTLVDKTNNNDKLPIMGWLSLKASEQLFTKVGLNYKQLKQQALLSNFKAIPLNINANLTLNSSLNKATSHNVVAEIKGSKYPNEYIIISAHWDHFGTKHTPTGDKIFNGSIDNATGVSGTIELARMLMVANKNHPLARSILFINFTGEEAGLLGSQYFAQGGVVAMKNVVAVLNIDGMNALDGVDYILQYGKNMSELDSYLTQATAKQHRWVKPDPRPQNGLFFRSDHFSFVKQGVPSLLFMSLGDTDPDYIAHRYHKETDVYDPTWSLGGMKQDISVMFDIAKSLANSRDWPKWKSNSSFKKRRLLDRPLSVNSAAVKLF